MRVGRVNMRHHLPAATAAFILLIGGTAQAAPGLGASSHRLGGGSTASSQSKTVSILEAAMKFFGFETAASVEPLVGDRLGETAARTKQCDGEENAEVAKAETQKEQGGAEPKSRVQPHEPVYLAF